MHAIERYSQETLSGDSGGNGFVLKYRLGADNLHALWDNVIYSYRKTIYRPFSEETWNFIGGIAAELLSEIEITPEEEQTLDFDQFHSESYEIGTTVYDGLISSEEFLVPDEYID